MSSFTRHAVADSGSSAPPPRRKPPRGLGEEIEDARHRADDDGLPDAVHALRALITAADRYRHAGAAALDLNVNDTYALSNLNLVGPMTQTELAARVGITRGASTVMIDRLEAAGLARRTPHPTDRRVTLVELSTRGEGLLSANAGRLATALPIGSSAEIRHVADLLHAIAARLDVLADDPALQWPD